MKLRATVQIYIEYDPEQSATLDQLCSAIKEGTPVNFDTDHCKLLDAYYSPYSMEMICPECNKWVARRPSGPPHKGIQHEEACSFYSDGIYE